MKHISIAVIAILPALGVAGEDSQFSFVGSFSQSLVRSSNGIKYGNHSDSGAGTLSRREIGLSVSYEASEFIDARGMVSIVQDNGRDGQLRTNYALIDAHEARGMVGVRLGRYSYNYGFYNATHNSPVYRDMEFPPQGLYRDGFRYMTRSGDGIQLYGKNAPDHNWSIEVDVGIGKPVLYPQEDIAQTFILNKDAGEFTSDSRVKSMNVTVSNRDGGWSLKYGYLLMDYKFSSPLIDGGDAFPMRPRSNYLGIRKYFECGDLTVEYMQTKMGYTKWDDISSPSNYDWGGVEGYAITYKHYVNDQVSAIIGYDQWLVNTKDPYGNRMESNSNGEVPSQAMHHRSINTGIVYRKQNYAIKGEAHFVKGANTIRADGNNLLASDTATRYNIYTVSVAIAF